MSYISGYVGTIIIISVLIMFANMLMPEGNIKKFASLVLNLLIIVAMLSPLSLIMETAITPLTYESYEVGSSITDGILTNGTDLSNKWSETSSSEYLTSLESQINTVLLMCSGVAGGTSKVELDENDNIITLNLEIIPETNTETNEDWEAKIKTIMGNFYTISEENINITITS